MNDVAPSSAPTPESDMGALVDEWLDWSETASALGVSVNKVRTMIREHDLAAAVPPPGAGQKVPALFIHDGLIAKGLSGKGVVKGTRVAAALKPAGGGRHEKRKII